ncbi:MAG TPA: PepSY-associated TM helix domain-containing protein [Chitinophagaceae bacterium]|nr:PepSY-associated TM helix domain-containing protein [Chitinophagaceae bacterium]
MAAGWKVKLHRWSVAWHRDLGYFFSSLIIIYSISGLALNHVNDWNPDFIIHKETVTLPKTYSRSEVDNKLVAEFGKLVKEESFKLYDFPTNNQVKIYYDNATLHINLDNKTGEYEKLTKRHIFYESNVLHRNSLKGWKWISDIFAIMLIIISVTGLYILKGKYGFRRRGLWIMLAGLLLPVAAIILFYYLSS